MTKEEEREENAPEQNLDIFDFILSEEDMAEIARLDTGRSLFFDHHAPETVKMFMGWR